jgi:hypothetical protein
MKADGSAVKYTDLEDILVFSEYEGEEVDFFAHIDLWKTRITIMPDTLKPLTEYHVEILANSIADREGNIMPEAQVSVFTTEEDQGIEEDAMNHVRIYPNPTDGKIFVATSQGKPVYARVLDISGKVIMDLEGIGGNTFSFDLGSQEAGIYFLEILFDDGKTSNVKVLMR